MTWDSELKRFIGLAPDEQWRWLAKLLFALTMLARDTYSVGGEGLDRPREMRRFNELIHRTASHLRQVASASSGMPDDVFVKLLDEEIGRLHIDKSDLTKLLR